MMDMKIIKNRIFLKCFFNKVCQSLMINVRKTLQINIIMSE